MICPKCNAELPEHIAGCPFCGEILNQQPQQPQQPEYQQPQQPVYQQPYQQPVYQQPYQQPVYQQPYQQPVYQQPQQPVYQQPYQQPYQPAVKPSKKEYLKQFAPEDVRKKAKLIPIVMILALALVIGGILSAMSTSFLEIPLISAILEASGQDVEAVVRDLNSSVDGLEQEFDRYGSSMSPDEQADAERLIDAYRKLADTPSVFNFQEAIAVVTELNQTRGMGIDTATMDMANQAVDILVGIIVGFFVIPVVFILLGGLLKNTPLTVIGMVFVLLPQLLLTAGIWLLLTLAAMIVQTILCSKLGGAYKNYCNGIPA